MDNGSSFFKILKIEKLKIFKSLNFQFSIRLRRTNYILFSFYRCNVARLYINFQFPTSSCFSPFFS